MAAPTTVDVFELIRDDLEEMDARINETVDIGIPRVNELVRGVVATSGKRLRPTILILIARAFSPDRQAMIDAAAGVELLHTASLVHDDDIDHAAVRRGKPTLSTQVSSTTAILIGDYLFAQSAMLAAATDSPRIVRVFASTLGDLCQGQIREMLESHQLGQSTEQYERRIFGKTASLFAGAAEMGAITGGAPESAIDSMREFGRELGMAFQIVDDVLDVRGETGTIGKPAGNDLREGTVTLPVMRYHARLTEGSPEYQRLDGVVSGDITDDATFEQVIAAVRESGALDEALNVARAHIDRARDLLAAVPDADTRAHLGQLCDLVLERTR